MRAKEIFPINIEFDDKETILIKYRNRFYDYKILDAFANNLHVAMITNIKKVDGVLEFGLSSEIESHWFRNILPFMFVNVIHEMDVNDVNEIRVYKPDNLEFIKFLKPFGFQETKLHFVLKFNGKSRSEFIAQIDQLEISIASRKGQIENLLIANGIKNTDSRMMAILEKIRFSNFMDEQFWKNTQIANINCILNSAAILEDRLEKEETLEQLIKNIISTLEIHKRAPFIDDLFDHLEGKTVKFDPFLAEIVEKMKSVFKEQLYEQKPKKYYEWIHRNEPLWEIREQNKVTNVMKQIAEDKLTLSDFGSPANKMSETLIKSIVMHFNQERTLFGLAKSL